MAEHLSKHQQRQEVAYIVATHLAESHNRRQAAAEFSRLPHPEGVSRWRRKRQALAYLRGTEIPALTPTERETIDIFHNRRSEADKERLRKRRGKFSLARRIAYTLRANSNVELLTKDEKRSMNTEAGINNTVHGHNARNLSTSVGFNIGLAGVAEGLRVVGTLVDKHLPFIKDISPENMKNAFIATVLAYTATVLAFNWTNLRWTQAVGRSASAFTTGMYLLGDRMLPNWLRNLLAVGGPAANDAATHSVAANAAIVGITEDPRKAIAATALAGCFNIVGTAVGNTLLYLRNRREKIRTPHVDK